MSILLDTSVLVAAMVESHPAHARALPSEDYAAVIDQLSDTGIIGGATYDALILHAAAKTDADQVVTLNTRDFQRVYPDLADRIVSP